MPPDLQFRIAQATPLLHAIVPTLAFQLQISDPAAAPIQALALHTQIRLEPTRRTYTPAQQERLLELFGPPGIWSRTVHSLLWTHVDIMVPPFTGAIAIDLPVPCSFDFNIAATKYCSALVGSPVQQLETGNCKLETSIIPLSFLFSGTVFHEVPTRGLQIARISWEKEADFLLPARTWQDMMDHYHPHSAWLCLDRAVFERLARYKRQHALPSFDQALNQLLAGIAQEVPG